jgi:acyl carrier protein
MMGSVNEDIRQYILSEFLPGETASNVQDDTPLRTSGILDSMATLRLVGYIEERYGIEVEAHEASVDNFETIGAIASFVAGKGGAAS